MYESLNKCVTFLTVMPDGLLLTHLFLPYSIQVIEMTGGAVSIPLKDGKLINIPVDRIIYDPKTNQVNISEEMSKTAIWKQLAANESNPNIKSDPGLRHR